MKEIHFYTNLCNEEQISDNLITDVFVDFVSTKTAIDSNKNYIGTTQLSLLEDVHNLIDKEYHIFIHNGKMIFNADDYISTSFNIYELLIGGKFGKLS